MPVVGALDQAMSTELAQVVGKLVSLSNPPAQWAEKHDDRHISNKMEGVNRSRGEVEGGLWRVGRRERGVSCLQHEGIFLLRILSRPFGHGLTNSAPSAQRQFRCMRVPCVEVSG